MEDKRDLLPVKRRGTSSDFPADMNVNVSILIAIKLLFAS
ncbi:hypothetical protein Cal6303_2032 [Calothrix sp. PCC 6303]|nr:hypothetical protein Cal6303_2032 [Calothrix sp. PCC 6303]